jgi:hypothetical protein
MTPTTERQLAEYEQCYRELAAQLPTIGLIHSGSITRRYTRCGTPSRKCHADPPQPHGPYYQWTAKVNGKTVTRRLTKDQAALYQEWIDNDRQLRHIIQQMRHVASKATALRLQAAAPTRLTTLISTAHTATPRQLTPNPANPNAHGSSANRADSPAAILRLF